jgi:hypothetical protein
VNFEVGEGKVYKGASCQSLGSNWERIERHKDFYDTEGSAGIYLKQLGKN